MKKQNKNSFVAYESFYDAILEMDEDIQLEAFKALFEFGLYGNESYTGNPVIKIMLHIAKENIKASKNKYCKSKSNGNLGKKYGSTGGRPRKVDVNEVQHLKTCGHTQSEVASILGVSVRSVKTYWNDKNYVEPIQNDLKNMDYKDYLKTEHWINFRNKMYDKFEHKCQLCGRTNELRLHHNTYQNRGCEKETDVTLLCKHCHSMTHDKGRDSK